MKSGKKTRFSPASFFILGNPIVFAAIVISLSNRTDRSTAVGNLFDVIKLRL
jgi:hypothetical protein